MLSNRRRLKPPKAGSPGKISVGKPSGLGEISRRRAKGCRGNFYCLRPLASYIFRKLGRATSTDPTIPSHPIPAQSPYRWGKLRLRVWLRNCQLVACIFDSQRITSPLPNRAGEPTKKMKFPEVSDLPGRKSKEGTGIRWTQLGQMILSVLPGDSVVECRECIRAPPVSPAPRVQSSRGCSPPSPGVIASVLPRPPVSPLFLEARGPGDHYAFYETPRKTGTVKDVQGH